jgi:CubicO group peptidase (beta-lactamase class C family)
VGFFRPGATNSVIRGHSPPVRLLVLVNLIKELMRTNMRRCLSFLLLLCATAFMAAPAAAQLGPDVVTYLGVSSTVHQLQFTSLSGQGYRPISLSVAGTRSAPNYTAVWIRRSGAGYTAIHGVDRPSYEAWALSQRNAGLRPYLVTAAGPSGNEVFAGVYMADGVAAVEETNLFSFTSTNQWARDHSYVQTCAGRYASSYCGVWEETTDRVFSSYWNSTSSEFTADFNAHASAHQRQSFVLPGSGSLAYGQIWRDDVIGGWDCIPGLTLTQMQTEITTRRPTGQYPICLQQYSTGTSARYSAIFATRDRVQARTLTATGSSSSAFSGFDQYAEDHMRAHGVRASALAITKHGRLVYARGFTLAEPGAAATQPTSMFRVASCSKVLTGLMTNLLAQQGGTFTLNTHIASYLGLTSPYDSRFLQSTVQQALQHRSGAPSDMSSYSIATWLNPGSPVLPQTPWTNAIYTANHSLAYTPGTDEQYSNAGYYLLGEVIAHAAGKTYERFLREDLGAPHNVTRLWVSDSLVNLRRAGEVDYHNRELDITPSEMHTDRRVMPIQYGGNGDDNLDRRAAAGGIITSPVDYLRVLSGALDLGRDGGIFNQSTVDTMLAASTSGSTTIGGFDHRVVRPNGVVAYDKNGMLWGSSALVIYRSDGVAIAMFDNLANNVPSITTLNSLADAVTTWPSNDLFPNYGLPSFVRHSPRIDAVDHTSLPNVTDTILTINGEVLSNVDRVTIGGTSVTSLFSWTWSDGWLRRVSDQQLEVHIPQGMMPGTYDVVLHDGLWSSRSFPLTITRATTRMLGGPASTPLSYDLVVSRGASPSSALVYLGFSSSLLPTVVPGIISLGIGNNFTSLGVAGPVNFNPLTGAVKISIPDLGPGTLHYQVAIFDPTSINAFPVPVTNVRSVQGL